MSKLHWKPVIIDVKNTSCAECEVEALLDGFEYIMRRMATTLARKAWYDLSDFMTAKQTGVDGFSLIIEHQFDFDAHFWAGTFEQGEKKLEVLGTLEKD